MKMKIKTISVTLSEAEMNDFRKVAEAEGISMSVLARRIIRDWLKSPDVQAKLAKDVEERFQMFASGRGTTRNENSKKTQAAQDIQR